MGDDKKALINFNLAQGIFEKNESVLICNTLYIVNIRQRNDGNYPIFKLI